MVFSITIAKKQQTLTKWIDTLQKYGRYTFTRSEAKKELAQRSDTLSKALQRLADSQRIQLIRREFYTIIPLEYRAANGIPIDWFIDDLMRFLELPYYVGVLSAAALHGAAHQQPQVFQVVTSKYVPSISTGRSRIDFFQNRYLENSPIEKKNTYTGQMNVSIPEWTALDLLRFNNRIGGLSSVMIVVEELAESMNAHVVLTACQTENERSLAQRLGWMLDRLHRSDLTADLAPWIQEEQPSRVRLDPAAPYRSGNLDRKWRVVINVEIEEEA